MLARRVTVCTEWLYSGMACGYGSAPPSLLSGRRCTCGWSHLHDIDLWQELDLLLSFVMLGFFVCVFWEWMGVGKRGIQWTGLNLIFPCPSSCTTYCPLSYAASPCTLSLAHAVPYSWTIFFLSLQTLPILQDPPSQSCPCTLSWEKSLPDSPSSSSLTSCVPSSLMSLGLFLFPDWAVNSFRTRSYSVHQCVLCTTLLYLN